MGDTQPYLEGITQSLDNATRLTKLIQMAAEKLEKDYGRFDYPISMNLADVIRQLNEIIDKIDCELNH